jgi:hypothetical protein
MLLRLCANVEVSMRFVSYAIAALIAFFGVMFLAGSQGSVLRIVVGAVFIFGAIVIVYLTRIQPREITRIQKIDLSGDVNLEEIRCQSCNAPLNKDDIEIKDGAIFVQCGHCTAIYQIEEEPKW